MYKATASGHQFLAREAMHSTKGSRRGFDLLDQGVCPSSVLTPEQKRAGLVARALAVEAELLKWPKNSPERNELGKQKCFIQNEIHSIRPKLRFNPEIGGHFIKAAKDILPAGQYRAIATEAARRAGVDLEKLRLMGFT